MKRTKTVVAVHTSKFIKQTKGKNAFIGDEIKGRLDL